MDLFPHTPHCELIMLFKRTTGQGETKAVPQPPAVSASNRENPNIPNDSDMSCPEAGSNDVQLYDPAALTDPNNNDIAMPSGNVK